MTYFKHTDLLGIPVCVEYEYEKGEPMVMYYNDGSGYPGSESYVDIKAVFIENVDVYDLLCDNSFRTLEEELLCEHE